MSPLSELGRSEMVRKELRQIFRDPQLYRMLFVAPVVQLLMFGYAVSTDVRNARPSSSTTTATPASRELVEALTAGGYFDVVGRSTRDRGPGARARPRRAPSSAW